MVLIIPSRYRLNCSLLLVVLLTSLSLVLYTSASTINLCHKEEQTALLQFKNHFIIDESNCDYSNPPILSWNNNDKDCCVWDGVTCDNTTGHIIVLDLYDSCLYGTIPENSTLFNLFHLQELHLSHNNFKSSKLSPLFGNYRNLTSLYLHESEVSGTIPNEIFHLPNLQYLDLSMNTGLIGKLSSLNTTKIEVLDLESTGFSGNIPNSFSRFNSLQFLSLRNCSISGTIPQSLSNLRNLSELDLSMNNFNGLIPASLGKLTGLQYLYLGNNKLSGKIPSSLSHLTNLEILDLSKNYLSGQLPHMFLNLSNISHFYLNQNQLSGTIDLNMFSKLLKLQILSLSTSGLTVTISNSNIFSALPNIQQLNLSSCYITTKDTTYFTAPEVLLSLDLSNNKIGGELHDSACNLSSLMYLDLSDNQLTGEIPVCFGNAFTNLRLLYLGNNKLNGTIPQYIGFANNLQLLDLNTNCLEGEIPRSLMNCTSLEVLNLSGNKLMDVFPFWLGNLPILKVLVLRDNRLAGTIERQLANFTNLHIIDLSHNEFTGILPSKYFESWNAMTGAENEAQELGYMTIAGNFFSAIIMDKGLSLHYQKINANLKVVDFSHNKFYGGIPQSVGRLKFIQALNLSGNSLKGTLPFSLGNLTNLESLDLSNNNLSGKIPQEVSSLKFLAFFNVSHNNFSGAIPGGGQLNTFSNASYEANSNLCGFPLSKLCRIPSLPNIELRKNHNSKFKLDGFGWEVVLIGYICGIILGVMIGFCFFQNKEEWVMRIFRLKG